jgi:hypothetical protein
MFCLERRREKQTTKKIRRKGKRRKGFKEEFRVNTKTKGEFLMEIET